MRLEWDRARRLLMDAQNILIITHIKPDGDAIGSLCGLASALIERGCRVTTAVDGGVPVDLMFIPGAEHVRGEITTCDADLAVAVDCGDESRMGAVGQAALRAGIPLINLDHHATNTLFGAANLVDLRTVAAAEGVLDWLDNLEFGLSERTAQCLLTGIVTDTLCFRTDNVTGATLGKAQRLMDLGAELSDIVQRTVSRVSYSGLRLWSQVLPTVRLEDHVIWAVITRDLYESSDYVLDDDAGLVSMLVQADQAYISAVFKQRAEGRIEIGFRAVPGFDTSQVAVKLGGGGHKLASGATVNSTTLDELVPQVVAMLQQVVREGAPLIASNETS